METGAQHLGWAAFWSRGNLGKITKKVKFEVDLQMYSKELDKEYDGRKPTGRCESDISGRNNICEDLEVRGMNLGRIPMNFNLVEMESCIWSDIVEVS